MNPVYTSTAILLFITPLLISPITKELFEFPKTIFLYLITGVFVLTAKKNIKLKPIYIPYFFILGTTFISTLFSIDYYNSILGYYTRFNGGLLSILCYIIIALTFATTIKNNKQLEALTNVALSAGILIATYSILQRFGIDKNIWINDASLRTFSTLGQPNWLAAYLIPILFISIAKGFKKFWLGIVLSIVIYAGFWFSYSMSGILTLFITTIMFLLLIHKNIKRHLLYLLTLFLAFGTITVTYIGTFEHRIINIKENLLSFEYPTHVKATEYAPETIKTEDTGNIRLVLWRGSLNLITSSTKQFLIGSGPQTFVYSFQKFMPKEIKTTSESGIIHNKPHNWFVEIMTDLGILGLISYLTFIIYFSIQFIKKYKQKKTNSILNTALFVGWSSISISSFFGWPTVSTMIIFFLWPMFFISYTSNEL